ncbi:MAG: transcriptional repressor LexA [Desulfobacterota bacterium]|nr:transcriptional repressor LexA [Thermodesulfobacteriota bacterium]
MDERLTPKQQRVFDFVRRHILETGYPPTVREIAGCLKLAGPNSAKKILDILERKGVIRRKPGISRAIEVLDGLRRPAVRMVPIVGTIRAGKPLLAVEHREGSIAVDSSIARAEGMFFLRVSGDSMREAHILDGDLALIRPQSNVEQGGIAAVLVGDEATLKYVFKERHALRLQPANAAMKPIWVAPGSDEVRIIGKVVGIFRNMENVRREA